MGKLKESILADGGTEEDCLGLLFACSFNEAANLTPRVTVKQDHSPATTPAEQFAEAFDCLIGGHPRIICSDGA